MLSANTVDLPVDCLAVKQGVKPSNGLRAKKEREVYGKWA